MNLMSCVVRLLLVLNMRHSTRIESGNVAEVYPATCSTDTLKKANGRTKSRITIPFLLDTNIPELLRARCTTASSAENNSGSRFRE